MDVKFLFFLISVVLIAVSYVPYFIGIFRRKIHPHPITWLAWTILTFCVVAVYLFSGGGWATVTTFIAALIALAITIVSFLSKEKIKITTSDIICFVVSIIALILWWLNGDATISVILMTAGQFISFIPTIRKSYNKPYSESTFLWSINVIRFTLQAIIVTSYTAVTLLSPIFWTVIYASAVVFLLIRRRQIEGKVKTSS